MFNYELGYTYIKHKYTSAETNHFLFKQLWLEQVTNPLSLIIITSRFYDIRTDEMIYLIHVKANFFRFFPIFTFVDIYICRNICQFLGKHLTVIPQWHESIVDMHRSMWFWVWYLWERFQILSQSRWEVLRGSVHQNWRIGLPFCVWNLQIGRSYYSSRLLAEIIQAKCDSYRISTLVQFCLSFLNINFNFNFQYI